MGRTWRSVMMLLIFCPSFLLLDFIEHREFCRLFAINIVLCSLLERQELWLAEETILLDRRVGMTNPICHGYHLKHSAVLRETFLSTQNVLLEVGRASYLSLPL